MIGRVQFIGEALYKGVPHRYYLDRLTGQIWRAIDSEVLKKHHEEQTRQALLRQREQAPPLPRRHGNDRF